MSPFRIVSKELGRAILVGMIAALCACASTPPGYNATGSKGQLLRQATGFDGNICYYNNGITVRTQGNCPPSVTSNVYQRSQ